MRNKLVEIARFFDAVDAHILRGLLEIEDIHVEIFDEQFNSLTPVDGVISGGVKLAIPLSDIDKAEPIIKRYYDNLKRERDHVCPECHSLDIVKDYRGQFTTFCYAVVGAIFGTGLHRKTPQFRRCNSCKYRW